MDKLQKAATHLRFSCRTLGSPDPLLRTLTHRYRFSAVSGPTSALHRDPNRTLANGGPSQRDVSIESYLSHCAAGAAPITMVPFSIYGDIGNPINWSDAQNDPNFPDYTINLGSQTRRRGKK